MTFICRVVIWIAAAQKMARALALGTIWLTPAPAFSTVLAPQEFPESILDDLPVHPIAFVDTRPFNKWADMLERRTRLSAAPDSGATKIWASLVTLLSEFPAELRFDAVHEIINSLPYRNDQSVWQREDYWASPEEFLGKQAGDCEDFAIAKYFALRELGVSPDRMVLTVYHDAMIGYHVVLIVATDRGNVVMDNRWNKTVPLETFTMSRPLYAINETGIWWLTRAMRSKRIYEG